MNKKQQHKTALIRTLTIAAMLALVPLVNAVKVGAAQISSRSITMSTSAGGVTGVTYTLATSALPTTGTAVKSLQIQFCESLSDGCASAPAGFTSASASLASQPTGLGSLSGWSVETGTNGSLMIVNASNSTNPSGAVSVVWSGVANPTATNTTFYGIITTYSNADFTGATDTGSIALSTSNQVEVSLTVDETLTFCAGTSITDQNCATISGSFVDLGHGSTTSTATGTSVMAASTNGSLGYTITVSGTTLTSGVNTITALSSGGSSTIGNKQFGINLAGNNTAPAVGAAVSGTGTGVPTANYGINNNFRFASGNVVASASGPTNANTFTIGYIANIDGMTPPGVYNTILTYTATANY
jgi:hypothetical protein